MNVQTISIDEEIYVTGESLAEAFDVAPEGRINWIKYKIDKLGFISGKDYFDFAGEGILFSKEAAIKISTKSAKPKDEFIESKIITKRGKRLDEDGLPILPPQKRKGPLINPYRI